MLIDNVLGDGQSETGAFRSCRYHRVEDAIDQIIGNAGAVVFDVGSQYQAMTFLSDRQLPLDAGAQLDNTVTVQCLCRIGRSRCYPVALQR